MRAISIFFSIFMMIFSSARGEADPIASLKPFTGYFRNLEYNDIQNVYSTRFFVPTVALEISGKYKTEGGERIQVLALNFEVPVPEPEGMALRVRTGFSLRKFNFKFGSFARFAVNAANCIRV